MKNKKIGFTVLFILLISVSAYFGYQKYQENEVITFNQEYQLQLSMALSGADNLVDSIKFLEMQMSFLNLPPQSKLLFPETKINIKENYEALLMTKADNEAWGNAKQKNTIKGYTDYLVNSKDGKFISQAQESIEELEKRQLAENQRLKTSYSTGSPQKLSVASSPSDSSKKRRGTKLVFTSLYCNQQQEVSGSDRITLKINGNAHLNKEFIKTGQSIDLAFIPSIPISRNSSTGVSVTEIDDWFRDEEMMNFSINGNNFYIGEAYSKTGSRYGGEYTIYYTVQ